MIIMRSFKEAVLDWFKRREREAERIEQGLWRPPHPPYAVVPEAPLPPPPPPYIPQHHPDDDVLQSLWGGKPPLSNNSQYLTDGYCEEQPDD
jgi:hypothetical protein